MEDKKLKINIDYKKMKVFSEYNVEQINYPLIVSIPHSGKYFPPEFLQNVCFDEKTLRRNEDLLVDELLKGAVDFGLTTIKMEVTRMFVDLNRDRLELDPQMFYNYPKEKEVLYDKHCRVGLGVIHRINYRRENIYNGLLDYHEVEERIKKVYDVYHKRLQQLVDKCLNKFGFCLVLDCHSMPGKICTIVDSRKGIDICLGNLFNQSCPQEIDELLGIVSKNVATLKDEAIEINKALKEQGELLDDLDVEVEKTSQRLVDAAAQVKKLTDKINSSSDTCCIVIFLVVMLIAIVFLIYRLIKKNFF